MNARRPRFPGRPVLAIGGVLVCTGVIGVTAVGAASTTGRGSRSPARTSTAAPTVSGPQAQPLASPELLVNASFEQDFEGWRASPGQNVAVYPSPSSYEGAHYLETNTGSSGPGAMVSQVIGSAPLPGRSYRAGIFVRSATGAPVRVAITLVAAGGKVAQESETTGRTFVGRAWAGASAELPVRRSGHTTLRLEITLRTPISNVDLDAASVRDDGLSNAGFELGTSGWQTSRGMNLAVYANPSAAEDTHYAEINTGTAGSGGSLSTVVPVGLLAGHGYRGRILVRARSSTPLRGALALTAAGGTAPAQTRATTFVLRDPSVWTPVSVELDVGTAGRTSLRLALVVDSVGINLDADAASLTDTGLVDASFESGLGGWQLGPGTNAAVYSGVAAEDGHFVETNSGVGGVGAGLFQNVDGPLAARGSYRFQVMARSPTHRAARIRLTLSTIAGGLSPAGRPVTGTTGVTVSTGLWTPISAELDVPATGYVGVQVQIEVLTGGVNVDLDEAGLTSVPPEPADPFGPAVSSYLAGRAGAVEGAVYDLTTGQRWTLGAGFPQTEASIAKVDILETLLDRSQGRGLTADESALAQSMIEYSDNDAASALWQDAGGAQGLAAYNATAGLTGTATSDVGWGLTTTTPSDQIQLLQRIILPNPLLTGGERDYALDLMEHVTPSERWGVSGGVPPTATVALKNGWLPLDDDYSDWQINSIGWVSGNGRNYLLAVLTTDDPGEQYGIETIDRLSTDVWQGLR